MAILEKFEIFGLEVSYLASTLISHDGVDLDQIRRDAHDVFTLPRSLYCWGILRVRARGP